MQICVVEFNWWSERWYPHNRRNQCFEDIPNEHRNFKLGPDTPAHLFDSSRYFARDSQQFGSVREGDVRFDSGQHTDIRGTYQLFTVCK